MKKRINKNKWWLAAIGLMTLVAPISLLPIITSCSTSAEVDRRPWHEKNTNPFTIEDVKPEYIQQYKNEKMLVIPENIYTSFYWTSVDNEDYSYIVIPKNIYQCFIKIENNDYIKQIFWGEPGNISASAYPKIIDISYFVKNCANLDWFALPDAEMIVLKGLLKTPKLRNSTINLEKLSGLFTISGPDSYIFDNSYPNANNLILPDTNNSILDNIQDDAFTWTNFGSLTFPASLNRLGSGSCDGLMSGSSFTFNSSTAIRNAFNDKLTIREIFAPRDRKKLYTSLDLRKCTDLTYEEKEMLKAQYKDCFYDLYLPDWSSDNDVVIPKP